MRVRQISKVDLSNAREEEWVDRQRRSYVDLDIAYVPVREGFPFDLEISERNGYKGRGFFMIGDIAVLHGKKPSRDEINKIISFRNPRGILWIRSLQNSTRTPDTRIVYGEVGEVKHNEYGYTYILDPQKVMFAQGNLEEKHRISALVKTASKPERVADMYAGIGYFTIPIAGSGAMVHAMEINPVAFGYLQRNIAENHLSKRIDAFCGDCRDLLCGIYDRIVMGHFDAIEILPLALRHVKKGSVIHLHSLGPVENEIRSHLSSAGFSGLISVHKVKKYRPHIWHVVQDVVIR
jgi:tRNA wybutosine-synthesizing protein 2